MYADRNLDYGVSTWVFAVDIENNNMPGKRYGVWFGVV